MELEALKFIGVGLTSFGMLGAAIGVGSIFSALLSGVARNPSMAPQLFRSAIIGACLAEFMGILAAVLAILLLYAI